MGQMASPGAGVEVVLGSEPDVFLRSGLPPVGLDVRFGVGPAGREVQLPGFAVRQPGRHVRLQDRRLESHGESLASDPQTGHGHVQPAVDQLVGQRAAELRGHSLGVVLRRVGLQDQHERLRTPFRLDVRRQHLLLHLLNSCLVPPQGVQPHRTALLEDQFRVILLAADRRHHAGARLVLVLLGATGSFPAPAIVVES
jgi:hypothetical protein